ncbi:MAG: hypothetical protein PHP59_04905 [Methanofollis sp.]|uniref:hypothetical protein n=1 Tax=Methanofollis sp. TaxID=2052835 RepID=UPI0026290390|nr:hypothetical protein [Methanofollis sp.]MDD4254698.1 hypothetical protein [Methanofollis sp.]
MKKRILMQAFSLLLAFLLVSIEGISAVNAITAMPEATDQYESLDPGAIRERLPTKEEAAKLNEFESPAKTLINELKSKNYANDDITRELAKQGYGWYPDTGACWKGTPPSTEELKIIQKIRGPDYSPFSAESSTRALEQALQMMSVTNNNAYRGINVYMKPSEMLVEPDGTYQHVITTHVGKKPNPSTECWTEVGVARSVPDNMKQCFTYDNDEGEWQFHGETDSSTYRNYAIYVTDTYESGGYLYHIWIDDNWVRSGHLAFRENDVNHANEIWSDESVPAWTDDSGTAVFRDGFLYQGNSGGVRWNSDVPTDWGCSPTPCPIRESHSIVGNAWKYYTWI